MRRNFCIHMVVGLGMALLFAASTVQAGQYLIKHPLCDGSIECTATTVWFYGDDNGEPFDRIEAHIDGTCQVTLEDGSTTIASTETLSLSDGTAGKKGISRQWRFPKGCTAWFHARHPVPILKDNIWTIKKSTDQDNVIVDPFGFGSNVHIGM